MKLVDLLDDPPSPNSVAVMSSVDRMPPEWRALIHEFGLVIVKAIRDDTDDVDEARFLLEGWRARRQAEWLATDYVTRRSFRIAA